MSTRNRVAVTTIAHDRSVLAKIDRNGKRPVEHANHAQAKRKCDEMGDGWEVFQPGAGPVFYVARTR